MDILQFIKDYLEAKRGHWPAIARDADVDYSWLTKVMQNKIPNPGIRELQKVLDYITDNGGVIVGKF